MNSERKEIANERISVIQTETAELAKLAESGEATKDDLTRFDVLHEEYGKLDLEVKAIDIHLGRAQQLANHSLELGHEGTMQVVEDDDSSYVARTRAVDRIYDLENAPQNSHELVARASSAVEHLPSKDNAKEWLTRSLEGRGGGMTDHPLQTKDQDELARMVLHSTHPDYIDAFSLYLSGRENEQTPAQRAAAARVQVVQRAMSAGTDGTGGYFVPIHIDPAVILLSAGVANPFVMNGTVVPTTSDVLRGVASGNAAWSWDGENTQVSDDTTTFTNTDITTYIAQGYIPISLAGLQSIQNAPATIQTLLAGGYEDLVSAATTLGTGSSQPFGLVTAAAAGTAIESATTDVFAIADVYALFEANGPAFRDKATWASNITIMDLIRQFDTAGGAAMIAQLGDGSPQRILGRPWFEASGMDGVINADATNNILLFGDFSAYWIAMGVGMTVKHLPMTYGGDGRPSGGEGWFGYSRFGANLVNATAVDILDVT